MGAGEFGQRRHEQMADRGGECGYDHWPAHSAAELGEFASGLGQFLFDALSPCGQKPAGRCERNPAAGTVDEGQADLVLKLRELLRHSGGGEMQQPRGVHHPTAYRDRPQDAEAPGI